MPIGGLEFTRGKAKSSFEVRVEEALKSIYPGGLSVAEIHERFVGRLPDPSLYEGVFKEYVGGMNNTMLQLTDLRMGALQVSNPGLESKHVTGSGKSTVKYWRWKRTKVRV
jgi:hypothetical protein